MDVHHGCNAYCGDGLHCDLVWTGPAPGRDVPWAITQAYGYYRGLKVRRVEPAPEAPDMAALPPEMLDSITGTPDGSRAWLVWWE